MRSHCCAHDGFGSKPPTTIARRALLIGWVAALFWLLIAAVAAPVSYAVTAGNNIYRVHVQDVAGSGRGLYTVTTGPNHPAGAGLNLLFGNGAPGTTYNTIRSFTTGTDYVQSIHGPQSSNGVVPLDAFGVVTPLLGTGGNTTGFRTTYTLTSPDSMTIVADVNVTGTSVATSSVQVTTSVLNTGNTTLSIGIRYLWDYQIGNDDGPTFEASDSVGSPLSGEAQFSPPSFGKFKIVDNDSNPNPSPTFLVFGTGTGPVATSPPPTTPSLLQYACWPEAFRAAYDYAIVPGRDVGTPTSPCNNIGGDSAVLYYFGPIAVARGAASAQTAGSIAIEPGASAQVSVSMTLEPRQGAACTLASNRFALAGVAASQGQSYWIENANPGNVMKGSADGTPVPLAANRFGLVGVATDGVGVYWVENRNPGEILRVSSHGGAITSLAGNRFGLVAVATDGIDVYWLENTNPGGIFKVPVSGGAPTTVLSGRFGVRAVAVDATNIYWSEGSSLLRMAKIGGAVATLATAVVAGSVATDGDSVYWTENLNPGRIQRLSVTGGTQSTVRSGPFGLVGVAVDATRLYWAENTAPGTVKATQLSGDDCSVLVALPVPALSVAGRSGLVVALALLLGWRARAHLRAR